VSVVATYTVSITQADVLYVSHQITQDLKRLKACYPRLLNDSRILELNTAVGVFLINDAVEILGFSVEDPNNNHLVYHELRYKISYDNSGGRMGLGGAQLSKLSVPSRARFTPWVTWSQSMLRHSQTDQMKIIEGTGWGLPGRNVFHARYSGSWSERTAYGSGSLAARVREYRIG
jgi:hypothetical protein